MKILRGVDFTKYTLSIIIYTPRKLKYKQIYWRKYLQSVEKIQW